MCVSSLGLLLLLAGFSIAGHAMERRACKNPKTTPYTTSPKYFAPEGSRGMGIKIWIDGKLSSIPDTSPGCLPIALRYNNPGVLKTRAKNCGQTNWPKTRKVMPYFPPWRQASRRGECG